MPLKIQPSNRPKLDVDGFCKGSIQSIELQEESQEITQPTLKWTIESEGLLRPMTHHFFSSATFNVDMQQNEKEQGEHNDTTPLFEQFADTRLNVTANLLKQLELLDESTIAKIREGEAIDMDLDALLGVCIRYKFVRVNNAYRINRSTITLDK